MKVLKKIAAFAVAVAVIGYVATASADVTTTTLANGSHTLRVATTIRSREFQTPATRRSSTKRPPRASRWLLFS